MHTEFTDLIDVMDQRLAAMQTDIDAALDAHQALTRARNLLADVGGTAKASHWPALVEAATKTVFTAANPAVVNLPVNGVAPAPKAKATPVGPKLATRKKAATSGRKVDTEHWAAVAAWIVAAKVDGRYSLPALAEAFDTTTSTVSNWPGRCRQLGHDIDHLPTTPAPATSFTAEPITKGEFDEQAARDAVAGPPVGRVLPMHNGRPAGSAPAAPPATDARPAFTVEQAHEALA